MKRSAMKRTRSSNEPTGDQRAEVLGRAQWCCERCGTYLAYMPYSIHHRLPRGRGGRNELANLVLLCGSATTPGGCHTEVESRRELAYAAGWLVRSEMEPAEVAVGHYALGPVYLDNDGGWRAA